MKTKVCETGVRRRQKNILLLALDTTEIREVAESRTADIFIRDTAL